MSEIFSQIKQYHNGRYIPQEPIKEDQEKIIKNHLGKNLPQRCGSIHSNNCTKSKQEMDGTEIAHYLT
jgi:hypothetical protein